MVLIQETKREVVSEKFVRSVWPSTTFDFVEVDAIGSAGGLLCIWNPDLFSLRSLCGNRNFILLEGIISLNFSCSIVNIYGPNDVVAGQGFWKTLLYVKNDYVYPWCIGGDFNEIRTLGERQGTMRRERGMGHFNEFVDLMELVDLPLMGRKEVVKKSWEDNTIDGWAGFRVFRKMKELKGKLKEWNYSVFGNIHDKVKSIEDQIHSLDLVAENSPLNDADILKRKELKSEL
ncbi:uncharacterized protein LOC114266848 [Camellia sinensis]|uniref:uncharacterized protein LOC114266848 n=1 Tax=Camellia sinensis TaxID=4442 RepID=UPI00103607A8|nr:uncharacterized protein LOC114266848 [Camellia sinensis]